MKNDVLLLGALGDSLAGLESEVRDAGLRPVTALDTQDAFRALAGDGVFAIVYQAGSPAVESVCTAVRGNPRYDAVALLAWVERTDPRALSPVFSTGADDFLPIGQSGALEEKLRELQARSVTGRSAFIKGRAVLADSDRQWRVQAGRVLRQAGYDVHFAVDCDEVARVLERVPGADLVVADVALPGSGSIELLESARRSDRGRPIWIAIGPAADRGDFDDRLFGLGGAAFHDRGAPPESLTFTLNATTMAPARTQRASARLLFGTPVSFRTEGREGLVWGATYNVSRGGLYVRTLTPAPFGSEVRVRLHAPGDGPLVELRARVVWRKEFGAQGGVPGPSGMGLQVLDESGTGLDEFQAGYDRLAARPLRAELAA